MPRFVFIDTEATGLDHARHELTEVAWVVRFEDGHEETRQYFPEHTLDGAEPTALDLTHYHDRIADQPRTPAAVWLRQLLVDASGGHLVGAVPDFDARHLDLVCRRLGLTPTWDHHLIDVGTLALPLIADAPDGPRSLARTCRALGVPHDDDLAHGALYDAQQAMRVFDAVWALLADLRERGAPLPEAVPRHAEGRATPIVQVVEVDEDNWEAVADVAPRPDQHDWAFPLAARYLLLAQRSDWTSLGLVHDGRVVGHVMWRRRDGIVRIGGLVVDARHQGRGLGTASLLALLDHLDRLDGSEVACTIHPDNHAAQRLGRAAGFTPTDDTEDGDVVWLRVREEADRSTAPQQVTGDPDGPGDRRPDPDRVGA